MYHYHATSVLHTDILFLTGITSMALSWLASYPTNRPCLVSLQKHNVATISLSQGVLQGSVLETLYFIIYMLAHKSFTIIVRIFKVF